MEEPLFVDGWTGGDEIKLLLAIEELGYGNWQAVSNKVGKTPEECKYHYNHFYINCSVPQLPAFHMSRHSHLREKVHIPHNQPVLDYHGKEIVHYNPHRGDFEVEPDNNAESALNGLPCSIADDSDQNEVLPKAQEPCSEPNMEDEQVITALQLAAVKSYCLRLKERQKWKRIIRCHGLIDIFRMQVKEADSPTKRLACRSLRPFIRFLSGDEAEKLTISFTLENELRKKRNNLQHFHDIGIRSFKSAEVYKRLGKQRKELKEKQTHLLQEACKNEDRLFLLMVSYQRQEQQIDGGQLVTTTDSSKHSSGVPLDISQSPCVEKLTSEEHEFCSQNRLLPEVFLRCKDGLVTEFKKTGRLKLMDARKLCRIDVNKTRKIYDLLKGHGLIHS